MSLILDALKKSDAERSRGRAPEAAAVLAPVRERNGRQWWPLVVALLALNVAGLAWLFLRSAPQPVPVTQPAATTTAQPAPVLSPAPSTTPVFESRPAESPRSTSVERLSDQVAVSEPVVRESESVSAVEDITERPTEPVSDGLPTYADFKASTGKDFGSLNISLHVYDPDSNRRFAFVDGRKVTQGAALASDLAVAQIVPEGVVLEHRGQRFLLPRD